LHQMRRKNVCVVTFPSDCSIVVVVILFSCLGVMFLLHHEIFLIVIASYILRKGAMAQLGNLFYLFFFIFRVSRIHPEFEMIAPLYYTWEKWRQRLYFIDMFAKKKAKVSPFSFELVLFYIRLGQLHLVWPVKPGCHIVQRHVTWRMTRHSSCCVYGSKCRGDHHHSSSIFNLISFISFLKNN
jgi:hypothetical protein